MNRRFVAPATPDSPAGRSLLSTRGLTAPRLTARRPLGKITAVAAALTLALGGMLASPAAAATIDADYVAQGPGPITGGQTESVTPEQRGRRSRADDRRAPSGPGHRVDRHGERRCLAHDECNRGITDMDTLDRSAGESLDRRTLARPDRRHEHGARRRNRRGELVRTHLRPPHGPAANRRWRNHVDGARRSATHGREHHRGGAPRRNHRRCFQQRQQCHRGRPGWHLPQHQRRHQLHQALRQWNKRIAERRCLRPRRATRRTTPSCTSARSRASSAAPTQEPPGRTSPTRSPASAMRRRTISSWPCTTPPGTTSSTPGSSTTTSSTGCGARRTRARTGLSSIPLRRTKAASWSAFNRVRSQAARAASISRSSPIRATRTWSTSAVTGSP